MKIEKIGLTGLLVTTLLAAASSTFAQQTVTTTILEDDFSGRPNGNHLNGKTVKTWDAGTYATAPAYVSIDDSAFLYFTGTGLLKKGGGTSLDFKVAAPNVAAGELSLKSTFTVAESEWVGLSFMASTGESFTSVNNPLLVIVSKAGYVSGFHDGTGNPLFSPAQISGFDPSTAINLELVWNRDTQKLNIKINGNPFKTSIDVSSISATSFGAVGARMYNSTGWGTSFDDFSYTVTTMPTIPEPSMVAFGIGAGCLLTSLILRRNRRR
ncbi:hypothetical protein OpiT1DRAFT_00054 [Opitutaceae bacterium TAV1]|nr:hypothetical protein OpiT1DRAFT_00054 [Opitutaceae bacterium TAV1]